MAKKCARTFSIVVEKGKKSILDVTHLLPVGDCRYDYTPYSQVRVIRVGGAQLCLGTSI
jgi:hypothetical protein